jgi:hypothetical protein
MDNNQDYAFDDLDVASINMQTNTQIPIYFQEFHIMFVFNGSVLIHRDYNNQLK